MTFLTFIKNSKEYIVELNNNVFEYRYKIGDKTYNDITQEERTLIDNILRNVIVSKDEKNHMKCGNIEYNKKEFQILYDKVSKRKYFYHVQDGKYNLPSYEDFIYLNDRFNPTVLYDQKNNIANNNKFIKILIRGTVVTVSALALYYGAYGLRNMAIQNQTEKEYEMVMNQTIEDLQHVIDNNNNLTKDEKEFVKSNLDIIADNMEYVDLNMITERLSTLKFKYIRWDNVGGYASYGPDNVIEIYNVNTFNEAQEKIGNRVLYHELCHLFSSKFNSLGWMLNEGLTEIVAREYQYDSLEPTDIYSPYPLERNAIYLLTELLGSDVIKKYYFSNEPQVLIDELVKIIDNEEKAYELLGMIDNVSYMSQELLINKVQQTGMNPTDNAVWSPVFKESLSGINTEVSEYFKAKYGYEMMEDEVMSSYVAMQSLDYYNNSNFVKDTFDKMLVSFSNKGEVLSAERSIIPKLYFCEKRINEMYEDGQAKLIFSAEPFVTEYIDSMQRQNLNFSK